MVNHKNIEADAAGIKKKVSRLSRFLKWLERGRMKAAESGCET